MRRIRSAAVSRGTLPGSSVTAVKPPGEAAPQLHLELARLLDGLPHDLGVTLLIVGTFGIVIPGPIPPGFSFILLGTVVLRPTLLVRSGAPLARRFPKLFHALIGLVGHFRSDLGRRYPGSVQSLTPSRRECSAETLEDHGTGGLRSVSASKSIRSRRFTGLTRWASNPASCERCRSESCP